MIQNIENNRLNQGAARLVVAAILAILLLAPASALIGADAQGDWWGKTTDIDIEAGSTFQYTALETSDGRTIDRVAVSGALSPYFTIDGNKAVATIPDSLEQGNYDVTLTAYTGSETSWMRFVFHVSESTNPSSGYAAYAPVVNSVDVTHVGNNTKLASIKVDTTNVATLHVDFADGVQTENIDVTGDSLMLTHKYNQTGLFAMKITASNGYGSTQSVVVYDSGMGEIVNYSMVTEGDSHPAWILYALVIGAILSGIAFFLTRIPLALIAAAVLGIAAIVDYVWII